MDEWFHLVAYGSRALTAHEKNYHSTKLEFLALKWAITEHFKEYLLYQPFLVKTDNNPPTYIMTTPNLDATGHWWVGALAKFSFQWEYQKGQDNAVADMLSWITTHVGPEAMQAILDGATIVASQRAEGKDHAVIKGDQLRGKEVQVTAGWGLVEMHVTNWATAQKEDPKLDGVLQWLESKKKTNLRTLLREQALNEEGWMVWAMVKISLPSKAPFICAPPQKGRMRICYSLWCQRCTRLPPWMDVIEMQDINALTIFYPYC